MRLALYQPDIPGNTGGLIRLAACLGVPLDVIEPAGFVFTERELRRAAMDYAPLAEIVRHADWEAFRAERADRVGRIVLLTTRASDSYMGFAFARGDVLLLGAESSGVPAAVHEAADARLRVPMRPGARSLNVVAAAAMVLGEALRRTGGFPPADGRELAGGNRS